MGGRGGGSREVTLAGLQVVGGPLWADIPQCSNPAFKRTQLASRSSVESVSSLKISKAANQPNKRIFEQSQTSAKIGSGAITERKSGGSPEAQNSAQNHKFGDFLRPDPPARTKMGLRPMPEPRRGPNWPKRGQKRPGPGAPNFGDFGSGIYRDYRGSWSQLLPQTLQAGREFGGRIEKAHPARGMLDRSLAAVHLLLSPHDRILPSFGGNICRDFRRALVSSRRHGALCFYLLLQDLPRFPTTRYTQCHHAIWSVQAVSHVKVNCAGGPAIDVRA